MQVIAIRDVVPDDFESICSINHAQVHQTSPMNLNRVRTLHGIACYHKVASVDGTAAAFLLAMDSDALYENENFAWFAGHYSSFLYVDRIVVGADYGALRLGSLLYGDLFDYARARQISIVSCEYNIEPPNERSRRFHDRFGFREVGTQWLANHSKQVSLQVAET